MLRQTALHTQGLS